MTNTPNLISQLEPSLPKEIMANAKIRTGVSIFSGGTGAIVTPKKCIPRNRMNMKPPEMFPPRKYTIPNQDIARLFTEQDPSLPPIKVKYPPRFK